MPPTCDRHARYAQADQRGPVRPRRASTALDREDSWPGSTVGFPAISIGITYPGRCIQPLEQRKVD